MELGHMISTSGAAVVLSSTYTTNNSATTLADNVLAEESSSDESHAGSGYDVGEIMSIEHDEITDQLIHSGLDGVAAAAAISSGKQRQSRSHSYETNPQVRKRQQNRLLRKLKGLLEEYSTRVGQQAVLVAVAPGKTKSVSQTFKVFGSQPLEDVVKSCRNVVMQDLEQVLLEAAPTPRQTSHLFQLPTLTVDGLPSSLEKMTQAQLRMFIPEMLKYSTGRTKPGWGKPDYRPVWWPCDLPWANVRCDIRTVEEKKQVNWTVALRSIIRNCYKHHGREDLLPMMEETPRPDPSCHTIMQTISNPDGTMSIIQIDTGTGQAYTTGQHQVVTLADGTQATVVQAINQDELHITQGTSEDDLTGQLVTEATLQQDGSILLADGSTLTSGGHMVIPASIYEESQASNLTIATDQEDGEAPESVRAVQVISGSRE